jgi:hypothetical protein
LKVNLGKRLDRYLAIGLGLAVFGGPFAVYSFLVLLSVPLTALGIGCLILGVNVALIPESPVPAGTIRAMVEGSCANVEAVLEEFNVKGKAIYLPPRDGRVIAYVPTKQGASSAYRAMEAPVRVVAEVEGEPALMVFPPGSEILRLSLVEEGSGVEDALSYVLVDFLEAAESVKSEELGGSVVVKIGNPRIRTDFPRFNMVLGSLPTSLAGCVVAQALGKPVAFVDEQILGKIINATFEVLAVPG